MKINLRARVGSVLTIAQRDENTVFRLWTSEGTFYANRNTRLEFQKLFIGFKSNSHFEHPSYRCARPQFGYQSSHFYLFCSSKLIKRFSMLENCAVDTFKALKIWWCLTWAASKDFVNPQWYTSQWEMSKIV